METETTQAGDIPSNALDGAIAHLDRAALENRRYSRRVVRRIMSLSYDQLMEGYYLGLNYRPDDESLPLNLWESYD